MKTAKINEEQIVNQLKQKVSSLKTNLAIYENDMARASKELQDTFDVDSIEAAMNSVDELNEEIDLLKDERSKIIEKIKIVMQKYSEGENG